MLSIDDIRYMLNKADLILRPQALLVNPQDRKLITDGIPDIEDRVKIYETNIIDSGTCYLIERKYLDTLGIFEV